MINHVPVVNLKRTMVFVALVVDAIEKNLAGKMGNEIN